MAIPQFTPQTPQRLETPSSREQGWGWMAWAHPPTFQRFPHSLQTTNVVIGSSELRVCTCGEGHGGRGPAPGPQSLAAGGPREQDFPGVTTWEARPPRPQAALASRHLG